MRRYRYTLILALVAAVAAILLYVIKDTEGFPQSVMLVFWPADYVWQYLHTGIGKGVARTVIDNVAVFSILAGLEGALLGFLLDSLFAYRDAVLMRRVKFLYHDKDHIDLAFRRRVLEIIRKYDPAGLLTITTDEQVYSPEAELILANLKRLGSAKGLQKFCRQQFKHRYGRTAVSAFDKYEVLAGDIWAGYMQLHSSPRQAPPITPGV
ncbi:MAG: hypothetical protein GWP14_10170 [Actinobacteria bacterium]|nr:hypothetical protein [Actinomycetota bacterium]